MEAFDILDKKVAALLMRCEKVAVVAHKYYIDQGRGAVVLAFRNLKELKQSEATMNLMFMSLEVSAEMKEEAASQFIVTYNPISQFVLLLYVETNADFFQVVVLCNAHTASVTSVVRTRMPRSYAKKYKQ
jgi:hypothetical protein